MSVPSNGSKIWIGAASTIIAALVAAVVLLLVNRQQSASAGELPPKYWESKLDDIKQGVSVNQAILRTVESHAQLQTSYMQSQNDLLKEIRDELRRQR